MLHWITKAKQSKSQARCKCTEETKRAKQGSTRATNRDTVNSTEALQAGDSLTMLT